MKARLKVSRASPHRMVAEGVEHRSVIYRLTQIQTAASRGGINQSVDAEVRGVAKTNDQAPYTIANEVVAARVGQVLGLPVPAGVIAEDTSGKLYYLSLDVSKTGHTLPPAHPPDVVAAEPFLAAGCVVFDILIANEDRHAGNLSLDPAFTPPRLSLFDHGHSLLGASAVQGAARLAAMANVLGCLGPPGMTGNRQALLDHVASAVDIDAWTTRVEQLPDYVLEDACNLIADADLNVDTSLARELADWLSARRSGIRAMVATNQAEFAAVKRWTLP
jgi:hypothetical protein